MACRARRPGGSKHRLSLGPAPYALFGEVARKYREPVGPDWRVDETYARLGGRWHYISRAIDGYGQIADAYVSPTRDAVAARRFFERAMLPAEPPVRRVITDKAATYPPAL